MDNRGAHPAGNESPGMLTIKAAAKYLGFDRRIVAGMCNRGQLAFVCCLDANGKPSRIHRRIPRVEVDRWIEANTIRTPEQFRRALDNRRAR